MRDLISRMPNNDTSNAKDKVVCRFAPSPTGRMHAGNIFAALISWLVARSLGGKVILRIEDLDRERSKPEYADQVQRDFEMLGLTWDEGPYFQHGRDEVYLEAYRQLEKTSNIYPCFCTRADLHAASAPNRGEKLVYPGTCRMLDDAERKRRATLKRPAFRIEVPDVNYKLSDLVQGQFAQNLKSECGDFIVRRSDGMFAYQLAVVVDDAEQGVNCVVRGMDLLVSTPQQMFLQDQLKLPHCTYAHVPLFVSQRDRRLAKRDHDAGIDELLKRFATPAGIIGHIAYIAGLIIEDEPITCEGLLQCFDASTIADRFPNNVQIPWQ